MAVADIWKYLLLKMANELIEITGFVELQRKIQQLANDKQKKREIISVLRQVAMGTVKVAKSEVPVSKRSHKARGKIINPGNLKKSIGVIVGKKGDAKENPTVYVGPRAKGANDGWYGHFVEYPVNIYRKGFKRKRKKGANADAAIAQRMRFTPFMQRAYQKTGGKVTEESRQRVTAFIQKKIDKLSR